MPPILIGGKTRFGRLLGVRFDDDKDKDEEGLDRLVLDFGLGVPGSALFLDILYISRK